MRVATIKHHAGPFVSVAILAVAAVLAGCGGSSTTSTTTATTSTTSATATSTSGSATASTATISVGTVSGLGQVLVNGQGHTLYVFMPDNHTKVTCTGSCAQLWPPAKLSGSQKPAAAAGAVKASLLSSDPDPEGGRVATYAGWPLYTYVGDSSPGQATGQGLEASGGLWYAISPAGVVVKKTP